MGKNGIILSKCVSLWLLHLNIKFSVELVGLPNSERSRSSRLTQGKTPRRWEVFLLGLIGWLLLAGQVPEQEAGPGTKSRENRASRPGCGFLKCLSAQPGSCLGVRRPPRGLTPSRHAQALGLRTQGPRAGMGAPMGQTAHEPRKHTLSRPRRRHVDILGKFPFFPILVGEVPY